MTSKTDINQERAAFEAHFSKPPFEWEAHRYGEDSAWPGNYQNYDMQCAWEAWQARAVVEADRQGRMPSDDLHTLQSLLAWSEAQICMHEETHRGGTNWEICDQCGAKWADDEGGKPEFQWPEPIVKASALLSRYGSSQPAASDWRTEIYNIANNIGEALSGATEQTIVDAVSPYVDQLFTLYSQPAASTEPCEDMIPVRREAVDWLKKHYPALCEKSGLCERIAGRLYTRTSLAAPAAAPVAQEPVAYWLEVNGEHRSIVTSKFQADEHAKMGGGVRLLVFGDAAPIAAQPSVQGDGHE